MTDQLLLATDQGVAIAQQVNGSWRISNNNLRNYRILCVSASPVAWLAGTREGIYRSTDRGNTWQSSNQGLSQPHIRWLAHHPDEPGLVFAGSEPAGIYRSEDGGQSWQARPEVAELRGQHGWFLPYSPEAGCVRSFAFQGKRIYAAVEVGGVLLSEDFGQSWRMAEGSPDAPQPNPRNPIHADVHAIHTHPGATNLVLAATGGGFYRSEDGGKNWQMRQPRYCRDFWVDIADPNRIVLGPAAGVDRGGEIQITLNGGDTWQAAYQGTDAPWSSYMVERFVPIDHWLLAILSNGQVLSANQAEPRWESILAETGRVNAAAVVEDL